MGELLLLRDKARFRRGHRLVLLAYLGLGGVLAIQKLFQRGRKTLHWGVALFQKHQNVERHDELVLEHFRGLL